MNDRPAVLALHYQNDVLHPDGRIRVGVAEDSTQRAALIEKAAALLNGARQRKWPIVHVRIAFRDDYLDCARHMPILRRVVELEAVRDGGWGAEFLPGLEPQRGSLEFSVTHTRISAFAGTSLMHILMMLRATRLLVGGVATHSVVEGTVRDGADRGFAVWVAADACAAADPAAHRASLESMALVASITSVSNAFTTLGSSQ